MRSYSVDSSSCPLMSPAQPVQPVFNQNQRGRANMAAKAGDDPDSLMSLATIFCLKNLRKTMCYQGPRSRLCLRSDIFLPSEICDKLVNTYVPDRFCPSGSGLSVSTASHGLSLYEQVHGAGPHRQSLRTRGELLPALLRSSQHPAHQSPAQRGVCPGPGPGGHP